MKKTLHLHIGHYKTGTTALQIFLGRSHALLARSGFNYPDLWMHNTKHSAFAFAILRAAGVEKLMYDYRDPTPPSTMWGELFTHVVNTPQPNTLISSEEFMRIGQFPKAAEILKRVIETRPSNVEVKAIVYLRDPASHLVSWYNQLVKMSFPVADLNAAVDGDIEDIHFDYRRALSPWIEILGQDNVRIRPYIHDRDNPTALHADFLQTLGIAAPTGRITAKGDPNPRFDDRVIELIRLMQNLDFPRPTITAIRNQALGYLDAQDKLCPGSQDGISRARHLAGEGLDWLAGLPDCALPIEHYREHLPRPLPRETVEYNLLLGFVLSEFIQLRQRVNNANLPDLTARLNKLEARLADLEGN